MRFYLFVLVIMLTRMNSIGQNILVQNNKSNYTIVIPNKASDIEQTAAKEFQKYFLQATGANLSIRSENQSSGNAEINIGQTQRAQKLKISKNVKNDGYAIEIRPNFVFICGVAGKGTLYGVYNFLERFLNANYFIAGALDLPKVSKLSVPLIRIEDNPSFTIRDNYSNIAYDPLYINWHKITHIMENKDTDWGFFGHTAFYLVPPGTYFKTHPEYYSLVNNKRTPSQLCLSNSDIPGLIIEGFKTRMAKKPDARYWMIGQQDEGTFCQCDKCSALYKKYGSKSGPVIELLNKVAAAFPNKIIATFAYQESIQPPVGIKPLANTIIIYAPSKTTKQLGYIKNPQNKIYADYMKEWAHLTNNNLFVWDYYANYQDILAPYPNLQTFSENFQFYKNNGVKYVLAQGINQTGGDMKELKTFVLSKLLWNAYLNQDSLIHVFCQKFYGKAADPIQKYISAMTNNLLKENVALKVSSDAMIYADSFLRPEYLNDYNQLLQQAEDAVANNKDLSIRVKRLRISLDYYILKTYSKSNQAKMLFSTAKAKRGTNEIDIKAVKSRFQTNITGSGIRFLKDANQAPLDKFMNNINM